MLAVALAAGAPPVLALSLGNAEVTSYLGQPLNMRVPIIIDDPSDGSTQCPRIIAQPSYDVPTLAMGRMDIERGLTQAYLRLTTALPVDEPALRVVLEIGCTQRVRREFTLLLDPPANVAVPAPMVAAAPQIVFGRPQVQGVRGQPLLMTVPIQGEGAAALTQACVHGGRSDSAALPRALNDATVTLIDEAGARALRIQTPEAVNDSRVRVLVEVGCDQPVRQEFVVLLDPPRLASTPVETPAPEAPVAPAPVPAKRVDKPPRAALPPKPTLPPPAPAPLAAEPPAVPKVAAPAPQAEPARVAPRQAAKTDRLVLAAPEEAPPVPSPAAETRTEQRPDQTFEEREQVLRRLEVLAAEVKTLRAELDASAQRNRELSEKARSASYAWAAAAGAALLLGIGVLVGWRSRPRRDEPAIDLDKAGPMTRILGTPTEKAPLPPAPAVVPPPPAMTEGAGPSTVAAILAAHKAAHEQDTQGASTAIMVTEFRDTTQAIGELYSQYVDRTTNSPAGAPTQPAPTQPAPAAGGLLDLSNERTTLLAPNTKTEIAVDIDLDESNTQIGRDLQREYERLDLAGRAKDDAAKDAPLKDSELPTRLDTNTVPMTTKLALDLDLDISTIAQPKKRIEDA